MKRLFTVRYPKLLVLCISVAAAYAIFGNGAMAGNIHHVSADDYIATLIAGMLFSFGFTTPFAVGFFLTAHPANVLQHALLGGIGAMLSDLLIFKFIQFSFMDEFDLLKRKKSVRALGQGIRRHVNHHVLTYFTYVFAGIIIASPLPDEVGVSLLAGFSHIRPDAFVLTSYLCNTIGIYVMLSL